jgi:hypothetical protein
MQVMLGFKYAQASQLTVKDTVHGGLDSHCFSNAFTVHQSKPFPSELAQHVRESEVKERCLL